MENPKRSEWETFRNGFRAGVVVLATTLKIDPDAQDWKLIDELCMGVWERQAIKRATAEIATGIRPGIAVREDDPKAAEHRKRLLTMFFDAAFSLGTVSGAELQRTRNPRLNLFLQEMSTVLKLLTPIKDKFSEHSNLRALLESLKDLLPQNIDSTKALESWDQATRDFQAGYGKFSDNNEKGRVEDD